MIEVLTLRPMQLAWIDAISAQYRAGIRRVCGVAVTGFGKTVCFVEITNRTMQRHRRVLIVAHRIEIVQQIGRALERMRVPFGWVTGKQSNYSAGVLVGMVQTVSKRLDKIGQIDLIVVDEAHHATAGTYRKLTEHWPNAWVLGVTASPARTDGQGLGDCFDSLVIGPEMRELIEQRFLADYTYFEPPSAVDLRGVKTRGGDYDREALSKVVDKPSIVGDVIEHYRRHLDGRPAIAFCASVAHAEHVAEAFRQAGYQAASVDGATDTLVRADRIAAIGDGRLHVLTSCDVISEGTDIPAVAGALLLRPTQSLIIHLQQCGRVLRAKADGSKAIILDHVGNRARHGLPDDPRDWSLEGKQKSGQKAATILTCPHCWAVFRPAPACPACGEMLVAQATPRGEIEQTAGDLQEVKRDAKKAEAERIAKMKADVKSVFALDDKKKARQRFEQIARANKYNPRWVEHQFRLWSGVHARRTASRQPHENWVSA